MLITLQENDESPEADMQSFDIIYYAALQVVIIAAGNGVSLFVATSFIRG